MKKVFSVCGLPNVIQWNERTGVTVRYVSNFVLHVPQTENRPFSRRLFVTRRSQIIPDSIKIHISMRFKNKDGALTDTKTRFVT